MIGTLRGHVSLMLTILILVTGCSVVEDYELDYKGDKLVVNGVLKNDQHLKVNLSRTQAPSGTVSEQVDINGANVHLFINGKYLEKLTGSRSGNYQSSHIPEPGNEYHLEIEALGFPSVVTEPEKLPGAFPLKDFSFLKKDDVAFGAGTGYEATVILDDPPGADYYEFLIQAFHPATGLVIVNSVLSMDNGISNVPCAFYTAHQSIILDDSCFDGEQYPVGIEFLEARRVWEDGKGQEITFEKFIVSMRKISESYYRFRETAVVPLDIDYAFFEPKFLYGNIRGGYGIFAAWNEVKIEITN